MLGLLIQNGVETENNLEDAFSVEHHMLALV